MTPSRWKPNTTVAAVVEHRAHFLLVEEETESGLRLNQPAGHLDAGESLLAACIRETREETSLTVRPTALVGIYQWTPPQPNAVTYLRFAYAVQVEESATMALRAIVNGDGMPADSEVLHRKLDTGIVRALWLTYDEVVACRERHRSPLVLQCIDDYRAGRRFPLDMIHHYD